MIVAHWVFLPESPPAVDDWATTMSLHLRAGRAMGRRSNIVVVAEGAQDRHGKPISSADVQEAPKQGLGDDARVTVRDGMLDPDGVYPGTRRHGA